jgi:hypothetical protein
MGDEKAQTIPIVSEPRIPCEACPYSKSEIKVEALEVRIKAAFLKLMLGSLVIIFLFAIVILTYSEITGKDVVLPHGMQVVISVLQEILLAIAELLK